MSSFQALISGLVQGIAEFLPISSSGHLVILHKLMGLSENQVFFDVFLHLGTLTAIFIVFFRDIIECLTNNKKIGFYVLAGTFVTGGFVFLLGNKINMAFDNPRLVGIMLIISGLWLILCSFMRFGTEGMSFKKALLIGLAQGVACFPGISRSGATISTGLFLGLNGQGAARFSFLLAIPATLAAFVYKLKGQNISLSMINGNYLIGFFVSCIVGVLALKLLLNILTKNKFHWFGVYCISVGILVTIFL